MLFPALKKYLASLRIRTSSRDTVESAAKGERVALQGTAKPYEKSLEGPISGDDCLGYVYEVEEYRNTKYGSSWKTIDSGERTVPFLLQADGGTVLVDDDNSTLSVEGNQRREWVEPTETPVRRLQELAEGNPNLSEHDSGINLSFGGSTGDKRRYTENKLTAEDTVYVRGLGSELSENQEGAAGSLSLQVGAPDSGGVLGRLGRRFRPLSFLVADASGDEVARRYGRQALWSAGKTVALVAFLCSIVFVAAGMN